MKYKAVIFDLDGVLVHTDEFHYLAWKKIADAIGAPFDREINNKLRGVSRMDSLEIILSGVKDKFSQTEKERLADEKNMVYRNLLSSLTPADVTDETLSVLKRLKRMGIKIAIGSSSKNARYILDRTGIIDMFDAISDGNNITRSKPDPEVFLKAAEYLCLEPAECIVVEDAKSGIDAACAGGFASAGIGDASEYEKCTYPLSTFSDLLRYIRYI